MPQTSMDYWVIGGVIVAGIALWFTWRQFRKGSVKTTNTVQGGSRNTQEGGSGDTVNTVSDGNDNQQKG